MKTGIGILAVLLGLLFGYAYLHSRSVDRARLVHSVNALLAAHNELRESGSFTNASSHTRVYPFTNQMTVGGRHYFGQLAADVPGLTATGHLVAAADGTLIWMDKESGPALVRDPGGSFRMPTRFRDF